MKVGYVDRKDCVYTLSGAVYGRYTVEQMDELKDDLVGMGAVNATGIPAQNLVDSMKDGECLPIYVR